MDGSGGVVANLILFAVVCLAPTVLFWCALRVPKLVERIREKRAKPQPEGPPIERVAADLRRVHRLPRAARLHREPGAVATGG